MFDQLDDPKPPDFGPARLRTVAAEGSARRRRHHRRLLAGSLASGMAVVVLVVSFVGYEGSRLDRVEKVDVATRPVADSRETTVLFVGSDRGIGVGPARADAIALVRIADGRADVLRIPRDLAVQTAGGRVRLATVLQTGGPAGLVEALHENLGVVAEHFVLVDPDGMARLIDLVGGVRLRTADALRDGWSFAPSLPTQGTGVTLPAGACSTLDGDTAVALARSRHVETLHDGVWTADGSGDLGRMARQNEIAVALLESFHRIDVTNPVQLDHLVDAFVNHAVVDSGLGASSLARLARELHGLAPGSVRTVDLPLRTGRIPSPAGGVDGSVDVLELAPGWRGTVDSFDAGRAAVGPVTTTLDPPRAGVGTGDVLDTSGAAAVEAC